MHVEMMQFSLLPALCLEYNSIYIFVFSCEDCSWISIGLILFTNWIIINFFNVPLNTFAMSCLKFCEGATQILMSDGLDSLYNKSSYEIYK